MGKSSATLDRKFPARLKVHVLQSDIDEGRCRDPNKCMIKIAVARALNAPHGYIKVDVSGISITRRPDYREKGCLPRPALRNMLLFENFPERVRPFSFWVTFHKTTKVTKVTKERMAQINQNRNEKAAAPGHRRKTYGLSRRIAGISMSQLAAESLN